VRSANHWDEVACRHGDPFTRYMEDAVDAADDEAEGIPVGGLLPPWVSRSRKQQRVLSTPPRAQPSGPQSARRTRALELNLTDEEYAAIKALAVKGGLSPSTWARLRVMDAMALLKAGE